MSDAARGDGEPGGQDCPPREELARYLDDALAGDALHALELHLVRCRPCRVRVLALREERAGTSTPAAESAAAPAPGPPRRRALALALTLVALAAVATVLGAWVESGLPAALGTRGAPAMIFDLVFWIRESAPAFFDLALPIAAMASVSALLWLGLGAVLRRLGPGAKAILAVAGLLAGGSARAHFGLHEHEDVTVATGTVHAGTLVTSARSVEIDGSVDGDLLVVAERVTVRGEVRGNVVALAQVFDLRGAVEGSIVAAAARVVVDGSVRGGLYAAADSVEIHPAARIAHDATVFAEEAQLEGEVARHASAHARRVEVRGPVGGDLHVHARRLRLAAGARIGGDVDATLPAGVEIDSRGAEVAGAMRVDHPQRLGSSGFGRLLEPRTWAWMLWHLGAGLVFGLVAHALAPRVFVARTAAPRDLLRALGVGLAAVVAIPLALAATALTGIGLPLALVGLAGFATALFTGLVVVAAQVGQALVPPRPGARGGFGATLAAGLAVLVLLAQLPWLGDWLRAIAIVVGLGLIVEHLWPPWRRRTAPIAG